LWKFLWWKKLTDLFAGNFQRMRLVDARLQHLFSWMSEQQTTVPEQSLVVARQMSAAKAALERAARMVRNCMLGSGWLIWFGCEVVIVL
jgi:hypothetical protein